MSQIAEPTSSLQSTGLEALVSTILAQYTCVLSPGSKKPSKASSICFLGYAMQPKITLCLVKRIPLFS